MNKFKVISFLSELGKELNQWSIICRDAAKVVNEVASIISESQLVDKRKIK